MGCDARPDTIGDATLYNGDSYELLADVGKADMMITDPPYAAAAATVVTGFAKDTWGRNWSDMTLVQLMARQVIESGCLAEEHAIYWFCDHLTHAALVPYLFKRYPLVQTIVWDKDMLGVGGSYRKQTELILYAKTKNGPSVGTSERDLIRLRPHYASKRHPAEKPLELIEKLASASDWSVCIDPFMGSGTAGVAASRLGRKFIGIEKDPAYFAVACERMRAEHAGLPLFPEAAS